MDQMSLTPNSNSPNFDVEDIPPQPVLYTSHGLHTSSPKKTISPSGRLTVEYPSLLKTLQWTRRYSSYIFSGFVGLHALNTCIIPLATLVSGGDAALSKIDNGFLVTRYLYRPSQTVETILVWVPLGLHVLTGIAIRVYRIFIARDLYGEGTIARYRRQAVHYRSKGFSWPYLRALPSLGLSDIAAAGYTTLFLVSLHAYSTRILPILYGDGGDTSISIVSHALQKHPLLTYPLYAFLIGTSAFHIVGGWGKWMRWTLTAKRRRIRNNIVTGTMGIWMVSLARIGRLEVFSAVVKAEYDRLYRHIWAGF